MKDQVFKNTSQIPVIAMNLKSKSESLSKILNLKSLIPISFKNKSQSKSFFFKPTIQISEINFAPNIHAKIFKGKSKSKFTDSRNNFQILNII